MKKSFTLLTIILCLALPPRSFCQSNPSQIGGWAMYAWQTKLHSPQLGVQGDLQYHDWNFQGDFAQFLVRGGTYYQPRSRSFRIILGYAYLCNGSPGSSRSTHLENRIYQELQIPQALGNRLSLKHRIRFEQRFPVGGEFKSRWRYGIFLNVALNRSRIQAGSIYGAFYNELFIQGQSEEHTKLTGLYDRNRTYLGIGYRLNKHLGMQLGYLFEMKPQTQSGQVFLSIFHRL